MGSLASFWALPPASPTGGRPHTEAADGHPPATWEKHLARLGSQQLHPSTQDGEIAEMSTDGPTANMESAPREESSPREGTKSDACCSNHRQATTDPGREPGGGQLSTAIRLAAIAPVLPGLLPGLQPCSSHACMGPGTQALSRAPGPWRWSSP